MSTKPLVAEFRSLNELPKGDSVTALVYGYAGAGKTRFAGTAGSRTLFINNGNGIATLQSPLFQRQIGANPIVATLGLTDTATDEEVHDAICDTIDAALAQFSDKFDTIVIDDSTQLNKGAMAKALGINATQGTSKTKAAVAKFNVPMAAMQDYQTQMRIIEHFVATYTNLAKANNKHLLMLAHVRNTFRKGEKMADQAVLIRRQPSFTGVDSNPDLVTSYFDNVWYIEVVGGGNNRVHRITTVGDEITTAKTRFAGALEVVETNPNFLQFIEKIRNSDPNKLAKGTRV